MRESKKKKTRVTDVEEIENYEVSEKARKRVKRVNTILVAAIIAVGVYNAYKCGKDWATQNFKWNVKTDDEQDTLSNLEGLAVNTQPETTSTTTGEYTNRGSLGGSFVDNHNQELYISGQSSVSGENKETTYSSSSSISNSSTNSGSTSNTVTNTASTETTIESYPDQDVYNDPFAPEYNNPYSDPNYTPYPDYIPENPGYSGNEDVEEQPPVVTPTYEGYVMQKLNYSEDNLWYSIYWEGAEIVVRSDDLTTMDASLMDPYNSNVYGLSSEKTRAGWVYVRDNNEADQFLDSCDNLDAEINAKVSENKREREEANKELTVSLEGQRLTIRYKIV